MTIIYTRHAQWRQARRNLSNHDVQFVLEHGRQVHGAGALHIFLGKRDIPNDKETYQRYTHLEGTVLVLHVAHNIVVLITAYRNRRVFKSIRVKTKYDQFFT